MKEMEIIKDCFCEHYLHELTNYPRKGLKEKKLSKGDKVDFIKEWVNFYGRYYTVKKDGIQYDMLPENLKSI